MARMKVYQAAIDGVNDWIVAAPNQKAALEAWGVHQNLFLKGEASTTEEDAAVLAALARPGVPLRRPRGSKAAFRPAGEADPSGWEAAARAVGAKKPRKRTDAPPKPDLSKVKAAEAALARFEKEAAAHLRGFASRRAQLEREEKKQRSELDQRRRRLTEDIERERRRLP